MSTSRLSAVIRIQAGYTPRAAAIMVDHRPVRRLTDTTRFPWDATRSPSSICAGDGAAMAMTAPSRSTNLTMVVPFHSAGCAAAGRSPVPAELYKAQSRTSNREILESMWPDA